MINPTTIPTPHPRSSMPAAKAAAAEVTASQTVDILPTLAIAAAVIATKLAMLGLLIHAL